jgi:UV DNA damage endonuclease
MVRLGVAARLIGQGCPGAVPQGQHLSLLLLWLHDVVQYLGRRAIACYRIPEQICDPARMPFEADSCQMLLETLRQQALLQSLRLSIHLAPAFGPGTFNQEAAERWSVAVCQSARLLASLGGVENCIVTHLGGDGSAGTLRRAAARILALPEYGRAHLVIEIDERSGDLNYLLALHAHCGIPIVFDTLHHQINSPERIPVREALQQALATWPAHIRPKIHLSTQRTEAHMRAGKRGEPARILPPHPGQHADFINPFEAIALLSAAAGLRPFDIMIEAKAGDLALLRLRDDLRRYAPELLSGLG